MIPPEAKKVFSGKVFEVWQWQQQMFDGTTSLFEKLRRPSTCCTLAVVGDKILVLKQEQPGIPPFISLPGGRLDGEETTLQAAKRELFEETGYVSDDWQLWLQVEPEVKIDWTIFTYIARNCEIQAQNHVDNGEKITPELLSFEQFLLLADNPLFRNTDVVMELLRVRLDSDRKARLYQLLFKA